MWFSNFSTKKVILSKKSIFRLIMTSNIFHLKIIFYIGKMVSKKFWRSKKSFPSNMRAWADRPPLSCCWENVKKCQNFTYWYFVKNSKNTIINRETIFNKIFEKTLTYGDLDETFQKVGGRLRVNVYHLTINSVARDPPRNSSSPNSGSGGGVRNLEI